jgi:hypothetical protein
MSADILTFDPQRPRRRRIVLSRELLTSTWMTRDRARDIVAAFSQLGPEGAHELYLEALDRIAQQLKAGTLWRPCGEGRRRRPGNPMKGGV